MRSWWRSSLQTIACESGISCTWSWTSSLGSARSALSSVLIVSSGESRGSYWRSGDRSWQYLSQSTTLNRSGWPKTSWPMDDIWVRRCPDVMHLRSAKAGRLVSAFDVLMVSICVWQCRGQWCYWIGLELDPGFDPVQSRRQALVAPGSPVQIQYLRNGLVSFFLVGIRANTHLDYRR